MPEESAYQLNTPPNGRIIHNLIQGANHLYDYLLHFYQLSALDFIDVTAITGYTGKDQNLVHLRDWVNQALSSGETHPAAPFLPRLVRNLCNGCRHQYHRFKALCGIT